MDKGQSAEVIVQDDKQDESSSGCLSEKTGEIILPKENERLNPGSSFGGSAGGITITKVAADGVIKRTEQKENLQSDDELMVNAATATKVQDKEDGADTTTSSSSENTSLTLPGEVLESKGEEGTTTSEPNLFSYLGLVKNGAEGKQSQTTAVDLSLSVSNNPGGEEQYGQKGTFSTDSPGQSANLSSRQIAKPVVGDPVKVAIFSPVDQIPGGSGGIGEDQSTYQTSSAPPRFIKLNLDQNKETIICCPVALLLQHKDYVDVTLQEDHKDMYSIKCCKCFREESEPYAMLEHLYEAHQIQGDLNKLLNLNSQHLGCMSHPECVSIPGVPTLPEGLSDLDNGVIKFNSMGIPRRNFSCRLCPLNFTTSRGLLAHHQYFTRTVLSKEGKDACYSTFLCKVCPRQFANFLDFYAHHKWMRVNKDLFAKEKKVNIMNNSGEIVASVSTTLRSNEKTSSSSSTKFIWGFEANLTPEKNVLGYSIQSYPKTVSGPTDSGADANELNTGADNAKKLSEIQYVESSISYLPGKQEKEEPKFGCGICLKTFPRLIQLQGHMGSHAKKQTPYCPTTYIVPAVEEPKDIEYKCGICSETFTKLSALQNHMEGHCKPLKQKHLPSASPFQTDVKSFSETVTLISYACDICNRTFLSEVKLWDHRLTHGPEAANKNTVLPSKKTDINRKKNHTCPVCKRAYYHKKSLNFHETKGPCKEKVPVFVALQNAIQPIKKLEKHARAAGETKEKMVTRRKDYFNKPSRSRRKGKNKEGKNKEVVQSEDDEEFPPPHVCDGCDKSFNLLWQLQRHKGLRTKANKYQIQQGAEMTGTVIPKPPYSCNVCHQRFSCFWQLKCHKGKRHGQLSKWLALSGVKSLTIKMQTLAESAGSSQEESGVSNKNACDNATERKSAKANRLQRLLAACRRSKGKFYNTRAQKKKFQSKESVTTNVSTILQYKCNVCSKPFARKASLRSHKISHNRKMKNKSLEAVSQSTDESGKQMSAAETSEVCDDKRQESSCAPQRSEDSCSEKDGVASEIDNKHDKLDGNVVAGTEIEQETLPIVPDLEMDKSLQKSSGETTCNETDLQSAVMKTEQETLTIAPDLEMNKSLQKDLQSSTDNTKPNSPEANESPVKKSGDSEKDQSHKAELESSRKISSDEQEPQTSFENIASENNKTVSSGEVLHGEIDSQPLRQIVRDLIKHQFSSKNPSQNYILEKQHLASVSSPTTEPETTETSQDEVPSSSIFGNVVLNENPVEAVNAQNSLSNTSNKEMKQQPKNTTEVEDLSSVAVTLDKNNLQPSGENKKGFVSTGKDASDEPDIKPSEELHSDEMDSLSPKNNLSEGASTHHLEQGSSDNSGEKTLHTYVSDMTEPPTMEIETSDKNGPRCLGITGTSVELPLENPHVVVVETVVDDSKLETETDFPGNELNCQKIPHRNNSNNRCVEGSSNNADSKPAEEGVSAYPSAVSSGTSNIIAVVYSQSSIAITTTMTNPTSGQNLQNEETVNQALTEGSEASIQTESVRTERETSKVYTCKVCSKTYAQFNQLNAHRRCHEKKKKKRQVRQLKANLQKRSGAFNLTCNLCGVTFSEIRSLNGHMGAHASHKNSTGFKNRLTKLESSKEIRSHAVDAEDTNRPTTELESSKEIKCPMVDAKDTNRQTAELESSQEIQSHVVDAKDTNRQTAELESSQEIQSHVVDAEDANLQTEELESFQEIQSHVVDADDTNRQTAQLESFQEVPSHVVDAEDTNRQTAQLESFQEIQSHVVDAADLNRPTIEVESSQEIQSHVVDAEDTNAQVQSLIDTSSDGITQSSLKHQEESQQKSKSLSTKPSADCPASVQEIESQKAASKVAVVTCSSSRELGKYSCEQCSKTFSRFTQLKCHMISHTAKETVAKSEKPYFCKVCRLKFLTASRLLIHMKKHGNEKERELLRQKMALQDTDHSYYKQVLDESENKKASETNKMQPQKTETSKTDGNTNLTFFRIESPAYRVLSCPYCSRKYAKKCHLSNHMNAHKRFKCTLCGASFWTPRQLSCHFSSHSESIKQKDDTKKTQESGVKLNTVLVSVSEKPTDSTPASESVPLLVCNQSSVILKKIFRVFLSGLRHHKKGAVHKRSKWFQPNRSLQRAALKCHQARLQKILGSLRKAIIMEIEADTHKVVYDCTECRKSSFCHKAILRHFLEKHLPQTEEKKEKPASPEIEVGEERPSAHQRFRNCPICKGSSGFQCHLHNTAEHIDLRCKSVRKKKAYSCDQCNRKFTQRNRLMKHKASHKVYEEDAKIACQFCKYTAPSRFAMAAHLKIHKKKHSKYFKANSKGIMQLGTTVTKKKVRVPRVGPRGCYTCRTCMKFCSSVKAFTDHVLEHEADGSPQVQPENNSNLNENSSNPDLQHGNISNPSPQQLNTSNAILQKRGSRNLTLRHGKNDNATNTGNGSNPTTTVKREDNTTPAPQNGNSSTQLGDSTSPTVQHVDTGNPAMHNDVSSKRTLQNEENNKTPRKKKKLFKQPGANLPFSCAQCTDAFKNPDRLWDHIIKVHTSKNPYSCTKCAFSTNSPFTLQRHQKKHPETSLNKHKWHSYLRDVLHSNLSPSAGPPNSPTKVRNESQGSEKSQSDMVSPKKTRTPEVEVKPGFTETLDSPKPEVQTTETVSQLATGYDTPQNSEGSSWMSVESPDEYFACSQCKDFRASTQKEWDQHIVMVHKGNNTDKFSCKMCQYTTTNKERLDRHLKLHRRMTLQCDSCPYRTPQRHQMIRHVQTVHKQQKPFKCKTCSYSSAYNHHLRRHAEKHKNPNFRCRYRKFMKSGDWHKIDTKNKNNAGVICKECGCELRNKKTLRRHQLKMHFRLTGVAQPGSLGPSPDVQRSFSVIHSQSGNTGHTVFGDKLPEVYQCSICAMVFRRRCDLNQHVAKGHPKTVTTLPSQCPQCGLVTGSGQLEDHLKTHDEENLLSCNEEGCEFKTAESVHLQRHQTKHAAQREALNTCRPCQMSFPDPSGLEVHNHQHHSKLIYNISARDPYLCSHCPYRSPCEKDANRHWKLHNYNLSFKCEYCVFSTSTAAAIATHRKIHMGARRHASTAYVSKASMKRKMRSRGGEGSPQSGKKGAPSLPQHVFMSTQGKKLYECRYCQRFFEVAEAWQRHELRHMAEWPQY